MSTNPDDDTIECPLCMEALEVDDINFFPCTCGYQICRFCWHRIRTDENGLCPACRKAYPEDPAGFKPLSKEEFAKIKAEKRHKNQQKKQKITENRKTLSNVRVVQKNLVFVLGLPSRFADVEVLKKHEYFGKFGKIIKVVINQSTSYAGSQAPCISAYVTYQKSDDALRAIQAVNNITVDGRVLKSSLGTTKYCSHFLKNQQCLKTDCMYLHEMGDPEASFTKEEMQQGKHQEFEKKLHDQLIQIMQQQQLQQNTQFTAFNQQPTSSSPSTQLGNVSQFPSSNTNGFGTCSNSARSSPVDSSSNTSTNGSPVSIHRQKQNVDTGFGSDSSTNLTETVVYTNSYYVDNCNNNNSIYTCANQQQQKSKQNSSKQKKRNAHSNNNRKQKQQENGKTSPTSSCDKSNNEAESQQRCNKATNKPDENISVAIRELTRNDTVINSDKNISHANIHHNVVSASQYHPDNSDNNSFFSSDNYPRIADCAPNLTSQNEWCVNNEPHIPDVLPPVHSSEDWQAAFGFASNDLSDEPRYRNDDGLDFDPFAETQKALSEMIEKEQNYAYYNGNSNHHLLRNNNYYDLSNHNNIYARKLLSVQQSNRIENCTKLLSELYLGTTNFPQKTLVPPPGFHNVPNQINYNTGIPSRAGNKLLPFAQQSLNQLPSNDSTNEWDWTAFDPSIVSAAAHRVNDFYGQQPPQGYPVAPVLDNKYMFNNYV